MKNQAKDTKKDGPNDPECPNCGKSLKTTEFKMVEYFCSESCLSEFSKELRGFERQEKDLGA